MSTTKQQSFGLVVALALLGVVAALPQVQQVQQVQRVQQEVPHTLLDIETPNQFSYSSPLAQPDSLRSKPYFDFLSTLYAHDSAKTNLFRNRPQRQVAAEPALKEEDKSLTVAVDQPKSRRRDRRRRAIVFRPLFVYQQREVRKQEIAARRRSDEAQRRNSLQYYKRV